MKRLKRYGRYISLLAGLLFSGMIVGYQGQAAEGDRTDEKTVSSVSTDSYNVMLVIDKSGSMNGTDREHLAQDAASMFVDSLNSVDGLTGSRVGVISFSLDAELLTVPVELNSQTQTSFVKSRIDSITYDHSGTGGTNLGRAVELAATTLEEQKDTTRKNLILLFTDGYTTDASREESETLLVQGIETANQLDCEIYVVGLNHKADGKTDSIKEEGIEKIAEIAEKTQLREGIWRSEIAADGAMVNYLITDSIDEVYEFYMKVYALLKGAKTVPVPEPGYETVDGAVYSVYEIQVTNENVIEANVFMVSDKAIGEVLLYNNGGDRVVINGADTVLNRGQGYAVLKIVKPAPGIWKVKVPGKVNYRVSYILSSGVELAVILEKGNKNAAAVNAYAMYEGKEIDSPPFYQNLTERKFTVSGPNQAEKQEAELTYDKQRGCLQGNFETPQTGVYHVEAMIGNGEFRRSGEADIEITAAAVMTEGKRVSGTPEAPVSVKKGQSRLLYVVGLLLLLVLAAAVIYRRFFRKLKGQFSVTIEGGCLSNPYSSCHSFKVAPLGGSSFHLDRFLDWAVRQEFGGEEQYKKIAGILSSYQSELRKVEIFIEKFRVDGTDRETYRYKGEDGIKRSLGDEIFNNHGTTTEKSDELSVTLEFAEDAEEKGW